MAELLVCISAIVGIAACVCTVLGYLEGHAQREGRCDGGHRGCGLSPRKRMLSKGLDEAVDPRVVEGGGGSNPFLKRARPLSPRQG